MYLLENNQTVVKLTDNLRTGNFWNLGWEKNWGENIHRISKICWEYASVSLLQINM